MLKNAKLIIRTQNNSTNVINAPATARPVFDLHWTGMLDAAPLPLQMCRLQAQAAGSGFTRRKSAAQHSLLF